MGLGVGQQLIFGVGEESTWGTAVTPDRFYDILDETLKLTQNTIQSNALRGGLRNARLASHRQIGTRMAAGDVKLEVVTAGFGRLLKHILGSKSGSTLTSAQQGSTAAYLHTFNLDGQLGKGLTLQKQIRDGAGTAVGTFTYPGSKVTKVQFDITNSGLLEATVSFDCLDEQTAPSAASASFLAGHPYSFKEGTLKFDGSVVANVLDASVAVANTLKIDRFYLGSSGLKAEQADDGFAMPTGKLTTEFVDTSFYNRFTSDTPTALVLEFTANTIATPYVETFRITLPEVHLTGDSPAVSGPGIVTTSVNFEGLAPNAGTSAVKFEYISADVTP